MKKYFLIAVLLVCYCCASAQENPVIEQQVENITEVDESETEDDSYLQSLQHYLKNKLNLNTATEAELKEFTFLSPFQVAALINYRRLFGKLVSIYELQAVPGWNLDLIQKILPFITVADAVSLQEDFRNRFKNGENSVLIRTSYVLEQSEGFKRKDDPNATSFYPGSRERLLVRYKYQYKNLLQYGITGEKDPGEQWFKGAQKNGFDFYSAHLFVRNVGIVKALALGDFTVNMGQGLLQWQSLAFRKSVDVVNVKRQATVLRPFNSTNEFFFNRGAGITIEKGNIQATAYASFRRVDGNISNDSLQFSEDFFSSLLTSGLHRTNSEQADKNQVQMNSFGGNVSYVKNNLKLGINGIHFQFDKPFNRSNELYNQYTFRGTRLTNFSFDWAYTYRNLHWFGEAAVHNQKNYAMVSGLLMSVDPKVDLSLVYRNIQPGYQTIIGNAFTESTLPANEKGFFAGTSIRPSSKWRLDAYMDLYRFPWLRFQIDAPSYGNDYLVQLTYKPNKLFEVYTRYRQESKARNFNDDGNLNAAIVQPVSRQNLRTQAQFKVSPVITLRQRLDAMWYDLDGPRQSRGFLCFFDVFYKPVMKPFSANLRLQYFETDNFDSRIYAYESDVLYGFSIPAFSDKGYRYYTNVNYDFSKKLSVWLRFAQLIYVNRTTVGSGLDEIDGNRRSEVRMQLIWKF
jgi:hypothetical protein